MVETRNADVRSARGVGRVSGGIILAGGILSALAYWLLPVADIPLVGSVTAPGLIDQLPDSGSFNWLRLVPWTVVLTAVAGLWLLSRSTSKGRSIVALGSLLCAVVTVIAYLMPLNKVDQALDSAGADALGIHATSLTGAGFWVALIGAVVAGVGAVVELATARARG
jgi:hypothetical protein